MKRHRSVQNMAKILLLLTISHLQLKFSAVEDNLCRGERSQRGFVLLNATYLSYNLTHSFPDCVDLCVDDPRCMSFNFWWKTRKCDLNSKAKEQSCQARFVEEPYATYMGMARYPGNPITNTRNSLPLQLLPIHVLSDLRKIRFKKMMRWHFAP